MIKINGNSKPKYEKDTNTFGEIASEKEATINNTAHKIFSVATKECIALKGFMPYFLLASKSVLFSSEERL